MPKNIERSPRLKSIIALSIFWIGACYESQTSFEAPPFLVPEEDAALPPRPEPPPLPADPVGDHVDAWNAIAAVLCECSPGFPADPEECLEANRFSETFRACAQRAYASFPEDTVREGLQCTTAGFMQLRSCFAEGMCDEAAFELCSDSYVETAEGCARIGRTAELFAALNDCSESEER